MLVTVLKIIDATLIFLVLLLVSSSLILAFRYSLFLFLKCLLASRLTLLRLCTFWYESCNHCILAWFLWTKNRKHYSSNNVLCCFNAYRPTLSSTEVFIFSLTFSQALFMSVPPFKFSKAANLFKIFTWHCFLTSSSLSFLGLNLSDHSSVLLVYLLPVFPNFCNHQIVISFTVSSPETSFT